MFITMFFGIFLEQRCIIVKSLENVEVLETETATICLILSKPRNVKWTKDNKLLPTDDCRFLNATENNGLEHILKISSITLEENGTFSAEIDDHQYGVLTSSTSVTVKGQIKLMSYLLFLKCFEIILILSLVLSS